VTRPGAALPSERLSEAWIFRFGFRREGW